MDGEASDEAMTYLSGLALALDPEAELPENLHLLTLQPWRVDVESDFSSIELLVRVEHTFQAAEHADLGQPATFDMAALLFGLGEVASARETTLGANVYLDEAGDGFAWNEDSGRLDRYLKMIQNYLSSSTTQARQDDDGFAFEVGPMDIRTFVVKVDV